MEWSRPAQQGQIPTPRAGHADVTVGENWFIVGGGDNKSDPVCASIQPESQKCKKPNDQCDYEVEYADQASSLGVLVKDVFPLRFTNGTILGPQLAFGWMWI